MDLILGMTLLLTGIVMGAVIVWVSSRGRTAAQIATAVAQARSGLDIELAQVRERATRVAVLEAEVDALTNAARGRGDEVLRLSTSEAQKAEAVRSLEAQLAEGTGQQVATAAKLASATDLLQESNMRLAALEAQAGRIPELERKLTDAERLCSLTNDQLTDLRAASGRENGRLMAELGAERLASGKVSDELKAVKLAWTTAEESVNKLTDELTTLRTRSDADAKSATEKMALLLEAKEVLSNQFKSLATEILEEKSKRFAEQNQASLGQLLEPLKTKLTEFQGKVEEVYVQEGKDRSALAAQVQNLMSLNKTLSDDAKNLTNALKGSAKTQGNWGELILERVLEASGLRKDHEYQVQDPQVREDGSKALPDVVINLPEDRKLVVDSKVSLVAYERYVSAETDEIRAAALKHHVESVKAHIKGLSGKQYHALYGIKSLDFVLAFVPIEPAFMLAVTNDSNMFMDAWHKNVLLVSPSTLLFVVRTVAHLWRQEAQSKNAQDIAHRGAELYDKLCGFVDDLQNVGSKLEQARKAYDSAHGKLTGGRGNVIRQAEMLKDLGVKPSKVLPVPLVEQARVYEDAIVVPGAAVGQIANQAM